MKEEFPMLISAVITAISTLVIAIYSWKSYELSIELKRSNDVSQKRDQEYRQQTSDLFQAMTIAMLISGPTSIGGFGSARDMFNSLYKGKTQIFK